MVMWRFGNGYVEIRKMVIMDVWKRAKMEVWKRAMMEFWEG